tara:strand:- start:5507 stop:6118 length:612 start_codon:yes stop_codon:yes gene_type:complete
LRAFIGTTPSGLSRLAPPADAAAEPPRAPVRYGARPLRVHDHGSSLDHPPVRPAVRRFHVILPDELNESVPLVYLFIPIAFAVHDFNGTHVPEFFQGVPHGLFIRLVRQAPDEQRFVRIRGRPRVRRFRVVFLDLLSQLSFVSLFLFGRNTYQPRVSRFKAHGDRLPRGGGGGGGSGGFVNRVVSFFRRILKLVHQTRDAGKR